ncbi:hypothetical protein CANTEDRAFT_100590 [Yamadazyma tenuis ATCC 10573]|uniref:AHC1-like C2H2 zinc-finger domain-containing protein n=1 Tax=Candida tenuis (strain ATCC 10573 / BCRC 21748 / CBS 615 / JCM 9827 / NBRC 10315 / NRRL Y-1498 / VKM Y-70) TaxID=590646 RepID=G3AXG2_CANTC|nr:uncharacterized protein CANTEDRAFT_100590 [Yamadazyma tenuis ATCC 10573]EGV66370.1 hypothetical protein CANTEDRAFT_100590 [Yamadazyma tenuis ATCC 10573]
MNVPSNQSSNDQIPNDGPACEVKPIVNEEQLMEKVKTVPLSKLKDIITDQIDLEIRLKHKELMLTEEEIGKCESQMITLRNYYKVPREKSFDSEPNDFTIKYYDLLNRSLSINYEQQAIDGPGLHNDPHTGFPDQSMGAGHTYRTRSTTSSLRPSTSISRTTTLGCLYRRTDGIIVKLTCPDCKRSNFSSAQGFLNHSRIAHTQEYTSQDAAALICGEILPGNEQDEEGVASINSLKEKNLDPNTNLNVNEMYFNGLSASLNTVHRSSLDKSVSPLERGEVTSIRTAPKPENSELMKKLIKTGVTKDKDSYKKLIDSYKPVAGDLESSNEDEHLESSEEDQAVHGRAEDRKLKRRRSRANVGIAKFTPKVLDSSCSSASEGHSKAATPEKEPHHQPLPKIKLRLKPEDKTKKRTPEDDKKKRRVK